MAITCIPNQPASFCTMHDINRPGGQTYKALAVRTDELSVTFDLSAYDSVNVVTNGDFDASTGWTFGTGWAYDGPNNQADATAATGVLTGTAAIDTNIYHRLQWTASNYSPAGSYAVTVPAVGADITIISNAAENNSYTFHFFPTATATTLTFDGGAAGYTGSISNVSIVKMSTVGWRIKNENGDVVASDYNNSNGYVTYTNDLGAKPTTTVNTRALLNFQWGLLGISNGCYYIEIVDVSADPDNPSGLSATLTSNWFQLATSYEDDILLKWTNSNNYNLGAGKVLDYDEFSMTYWMRIKGWLGNMVAVKDKTIYRYSDGSMAVAAANSVPHRTLKTDGLPEYQHEALQIAIDHDTFYIDGTSYFSEDDEYSPRWRRNSILAPVDIEVIRQQDQQRNSSC